MIFDIKKSENKKVEEMCERAMKELGDFFLIDWNENKPKILLVDSREVMNELSEEETEDWHIATTSKSDDMIAVFPPDKIERASNHVHKYSDTFYYELLKHELAHQYIGMIRKTYHPFWLDEGIAEYVSGQTKSMKKPKKFVNFLKYFDYEDRDTYIESPFAVEILIKQFGKEKLLKFLKISDVEDEKEFKKIFEDFFDIELGYEWFNKMLKES